MAGDIPPFDGSSIDAEPEPDTWRDEDAAKETGAPDATETGAIASDGTMNDAARDASVLDALPTEADALGPASDVATSTDVAMPAPDATSAHDASSEDSAATCAPPPVAPDGCLELAPLPAPPIIDGNLECGVALHAWVPMGWSGGATLNDTTASYAVRWRPDGMYFYVLVHDPATIPAEPAALAWMGDAVEIYLDSDGTIAPPNFDNPGARQIIISSPSSAAPAYARAQLFSFGNAGFPLDWQSEFGAFTKPGGYAVEGFIRAQDLGLSTWSLSPGQSVGLDLSIDVSYPDAATVGLEGHRAGQYFLHLDAALGATPPFSNSGAFCKPVLLAQ